MKSNNVFQTILSFNEIKKGVYNNIFSCVQLYCNNSYKWGCQLVFMGLSLDSEIFVKGVTRNACEVPLNHEQIKTLEAGYKVVSGCEGGIISVGVIDDAFSLVGNPMEDGSFDYVKNWLGSSGRKLLSLRGINPSEGDKQACEEFQEGNSNWGPILNVNEKRFYLLEDGSNNSLFLGVLDGPKGASKYLVKITYKKAN